MEERKNSGIQRAGHSGLIRYSNGREKEESREVRGTLHNEKEDENRKNDIRQDGQAGIHRQTEPGRRQKYKRRRVKGGGEGSGAPKRYTDRESSRKGRKKKTSKEKKEEKKARRSGYERNPLEVSKRRKKTILITRRKADLAHKRRNSQLRIAGEEKPGQDGIKRIEKKRGVSGVRASAKGNAPADRAGKEGPSPGREKGGFRHGGDRDGNRKRIQAAAQKQNASRHPVVVSSVAAPGRTYKDALKDTAQKAAKNSMLISGRAVKNTLSRGLEKENQFETDVINQPIRTLDLVLHTKNTMIRSGKTAYKTGRAAVKGVRGAWQGAKTAYRGVKTARNWIKAFRSSQQKIKMLREAAQKLIEEAVRAGQQAVRLAIQVAAKILLFVVQALVAVGLPAAVVLILTAAVLSLLTVFSVTEMVPYLDYESMDVSKKLWDENLAAYCRWAEDYKKGFIENECVTDCDYDHNDTVNAGYYMNGYRVALDNRAALIYAAAYAKYGDISVIGQVEHHPLIYSSYPVLKEAGKIKDFMKDCLVFLYPQDESLVTGNEERIEEEECREEEDEDGQYRHEHEYGEWKLGFPLRSEADLLEYLDLSGEEMERYRTISDELARQMEEETEKEVAEKGFSLFDYFGYYGNGFENGELLKELLESGEIELTEVTEYALQFVGNPYVWGGTSLTDGVDCSGFVKAVYEHFGVSGIPRTSQQQSQTGVLIPDISQARPGDLIFYGSPVHHVALYLGGGRIVHASNSKPYPAGGIKTSDAMYAPIACIRRWVE